MDGELYDVCIDDLADEAYEQRRQEQLDAGELPAPSPIPDRWTKQMTTEEWGWVQALVATSERTAR